MGDGIRGGRALCGIPGADGICTPNELQTARWDHRGQTDHGCSVSIARRRGGILMSAWQHHLSMSPISGALGAEVSELSLRILTSPLLRKFRRRSSNIR